jgi:tetratricopeptide (TPR) repeat protein
MAIEHAEGYLELGLPAQALAALARLSVDEMQDARALYLRGEALRSLERYDEAIDWLGQAADLVPDDIHIWLALGWCQKRVGRMDAAIGALENALSADPGEAIIYYNLACYWSLVHNKPHALAYLANAFEIDSNYRDLVHEEPDFEPLRNDPDFQELTSVIV